MPPLPRFASLTVAVSLLVACSGESSSSDTVTHDASTPKDARGTTDATDAHADRQAPKDVAVPDDVFVPNRMPGQRTPLTAACGPSDGIRCLLPWPNNTFTAVDTTTETGLRIHVSQQGLVMGDDPSSINRADGFSRVTPIETGWNGTLDPTTFGDKTTGAVRVIVEQPGSTFGQLVPCRFDTIVTLQAPFQSLLVAYPLVPLAPATDYAVVVMDSAHYTGGAPLMADRDAQVGLGLVTPTTPAEGALYAYDAPLRAAMKVAGVDPTHAVRAWDFTTRSLTEPTSDLLAMRKAEIAAFDSSSIGGDAGVDGGGLASLDAGGARDGGDGGSKTGDGGAGSDASTGTGIGLAVDSISTTETGTVLVAVLGRVTNVPYYRTSTGSLNRDATGALAQAGVHDVPFRAAIPVGTGDYRLVMYGHGLGGTYDETSFDEEITSGGAVKIGTQFMGWTASTIVDTFGLMNHVLVGSDIAAASLTQSLADQTLVQHALGGSLGELLAAPFLAGSANPAAGRRPNMNQPVWAGGSLGGTMGYVYSSAEPSISAAVLNVPGAAWTQFVVYSEIFDYVELIMLANYQTVVDIWLGIAESATNFDPADGAVWYDAVTTPHPILLEQESIGDPVLPNIGNDMVAASSHAYQVGVALHPIETCTDVPSATNHSGMTQFKVPNTVTQDLDIHGFAAKSTPAGIAAQQQIVSFITSVWQSPSPSITVPPECVTNTPVDSCDFSGPPLVDASSP